MRQDLFNRVSWQLSTRANVKVYAWMPVLAFDFDASIPLVQRINPTTGKTELDTSAYRRVSPFDPVARAKILALYEDLARSSPFEGILFHDDAMLTDYEDASPPALAAYVRAGLPASVQAIKANPAYMRKWTDLKIDTLIAFTNELAAHLRKYRIPLATARNIYAPVVLTPESKEWFAQQFDKFLTNYDYTSVMAMPAMENVPDRLADDWLKHLVAEVATRPGALQRTIFELQSVDWRPKKGSDDRNIPTQTLGAQMQLLARAGAMNFGYYPDDFITNHPNAAELHRNFSLQTYPYLK
jgi:biofilm PGA synthesis lipoprotein PgaB